jgi:O-antigen/teichoic acid export membrane protein
VTASEDVGGSLRRPPILDSTLAMYGTQLFAATLQLLNVLIVARVLGASGRGEVVFLSAIAYLTAQVAALGVHQAAANIAANRPRLRPSLATNAVLFSLVLGGLAAGLVYLLMLVAPAVGGGTDVDLRLLALGVIPVLVLEANFAMLVRADYAFRIANLALVLVPLAIAGVNVAFALAGRLTVGTAFGVWIAGQVLGVLLLGAFVQRRLAGFGRPSLPLALGCLSFGVKAHAGRVMLVGNYKLDQWLVGAIAGTRELGLYSIAVTWFETLFYLPTALAAVQRPDLVRASRRGAGVNAALAFRAASLVTAGLVVVVLVAAPVLCVTFFGEEFRGSVDDLRVLVPGAAGVLALKLLGNALVAQGKPLRESAAIGVTFVGTLALDLLLVPPYGGLGAAIASTVGYAVGGVAMIVLFSRAFGGRVSELVPRGSEVPWFWRKVRLAFRRPATALELESN